MIDIDTALVLVLGVPIGALVGLWAYHRGYMRGVHHGQLRAIVRDGVSDEPPLINRCEPCALGYCDGCAEQATHAPPGTPCPCLDCHEVGDPPPLAR